MMKMSEDMNKTLKTKTESKKDLSAKEVRERLHAEHNSRGRGRSPDSDDLATIGNGATLKSVGRWYNYYAATASTISGSANNNNATVDICPSGWHLPSGPNTIATTDYNTIIGNTTSGYQSATTGLTAFGVLNSDMYGSNGSLDVYSRWISSTASNDAYRYALGYYDNQYIGDLNGNRVAGYSIRCVKSS